MKNILKTIGLLPIAFILGTFVYAGVVAFMILGYFVGILMLPTKSLSFDLATGLCKTLHQELITQ